MRPLFRISARVVPQDGQAAPPASGAAPDAHGLRALIEAAIAPGAPLQPLAALRDELVRRYVELAVERCGGDREAAAKSLEIGVRTLYRHLA